MTPIDVVSTTDKAETPAAAVVEAKPETEATASAPVEQTEQNTAQESETEGTEAQDAATTDEEAADDKPKKKGGFQRRIDKLNARNAAVQAELEYWKQRAMEHAQASGAKPDKVETVAKHPDGKPIPDQFETHAEYVEALTEWKTDQKLKALEAKQERQKLETEQQSIQRSHSERVAAFAKTHEDFAELMEAVEDIPVPTTVAQFVMSSEHGPALMYELAKNREEFERICKLSPIAAAAELGEIRARIRSQASDAKKPETKEQLRPQRQLTPSDRKGASVEKTIYDPNISQREYERLRAKQQASA